jgi:hypothetical protein
MHLTNINLIESLSADQYTDLGQQCYIRDQYQKRYPTPVETPVTHPWKFDPLNPPQGWRYDPYYELWIENE